MAKTVPMRGVLSLNTRPFESALGRAGLKAKGFATGTSKAMLGVAAAVGTVTLAVKGLQAAYDKASEARDKFAAADTLRRRSAIAMGGNFQQNLPTVSRMGADLAAQYGISETQIQPALYDAFSTTENLKEASEVMEIAARNFWLSGTDLQTTVKTFTDNAKIFGVATSDYADAAAFLTTISKLTPEEVAQFAPQFLGRGAALNVGLREQFAQFGTAATRFRPEQASTRLGEFYNALSDPNHKLTAALIDFSGEMPSQMDDLVGQLAALREAVGDDAFAALATGSVGDIAKVLTDDATYRKMLEKMTGDISGSFEEMSDFMLESEELRQQSLNERLENIWKNFGEQVSPMLGDFQEKMMELTEQTLPVLMSSIVGLSGLLETFAGGARFATDAALDMGTYITNWWQKGPLSTAWWGGGANFGAQGTATPEQMKLDRILEQASVYLGKNYEDWAERGAEVAYKYIDEDRKTQTDDLTFTQAVGFMAKQVEDGLAVEPFDDNITALLSPENINEMAALLLESGIADPEALRAIGAASEEYEPLLEVADRMDKVVEINTKLAEMYDGSYELWRQYLPGIAESTEGADDKLGDLQEDKDRALFFSPIETGDFARVGP